MNVKKMMIIVIALFLLLSGLNLNGAVLGKLRVKVVESREEAIQRSIADDPHAQAVNAFNKAAEFINRKKYADALEPLKPAIGLSKAKWISRAPSRLKTEISIYNT